MATKRAYPRYRDLIGETPLIDLSHLQDDEDSPVQILAKCEFLNPGYSVKDRIVSHIFEQAEQEGRLKKGSRVLAASSGNTGAAVAMMAAWRGYEAIIVTSPKCSQEKMDTIRAYGATLIVADGSNGNYMDVAEQLAAEDPDLFDVNQYANPLNPDAHYRTLGQEIWRQTDGAVTHFTCGASTGGTICGVSRSLKEHNPDVRSVLSDPVGSIFKEFYETGDYGKGKKFHVEGVGKGNIPDTMDFKWIDALIPVEDKDTFETCRMLAEREGLMIGGSSGLNVYGALQLAKQLDEPAVIVTVLVDSGLKYISKIFNQEWLNANVYASSC